jgi:hypothetical protein
MKKSEGFEKNRHSPGIKNHQFVAEFSLLPDYTLNKLANRKMDFENIPNKTENPSSPYPRALY